MVESKSVLLVEDHEEIRTLLRMFMQIAGHTVTPVGSGADALSAMQQKKFDIIVSDIGLPDMDGLALLRQIEDRYEVDCISMSAMSVTPDISKLPRCKAHLMKPFDPLQLVELIEHT